MYTHNRHSLRRRRRFITDAVIESSGLTAKALGRDDLGRVYWKFPNCEYMFICTAYDMGHELNMKAELTASLTSTTTTTSNNSSGSDADKDNTTISAEPVWKVATDKTDVRRIISKLSSASPAEVNLKQNIIASVLDDRINNQLWDTAVSGPKPLPSTTTVSATQDIVEATHEDTSTAEPAEGDAAEGAVVDEDEKMDIEDDNKSASVQHEAPIERVKRPVREAVISSTTRAVTRPVPEPETLTLRLLTDKGLPVSSEYTIKEEVMFVSDGDREEGDGEEEGELDHKEYYDFGKK